MLLNKIVKFFPTPAILQIPFAGVYISDNCIRVVELRRNKHGFSVDKYTEVSLPVGVVSSGTIIKKEELAKCLQDIKTKLSLDYVKVSLPEEKAYLFTTKLPMVTAIEARSAIESKIEENVPVAPNELVFDYRIISHIEREHLDVVVSTIPESVVLLYKEILESAGLNPLSLEIESQALARAIIKSNDLDTQLLVYFSPGKVGLYVCRNRLVHFTSTTSTKMTNYDLSDFVLQEIKKLSVYWHTLKDNIDKPEKKITKIVVCGEGFNDDIIGFLANKQDLPVFKGDVWVNVMDINLEIPEISFEESLRYATAVGLALPQDNLI